ncbi:hypothetical protein SORBI_3004G117950 [Sorghum bicolor]|uniref:Uncharacterized protein n=1 Tax=Sorghum bicolor TaxID=4558 RepID=A0A1Z5RMZ6_SORBI|nr:hypothetical protein SORBI_3004G117950 [Sorghum bicolor]
MYVAILKSVYVSSNLCMIVCECTFVGKVGQNLRQFNLPKVGYCFVLSRLPWDKLLFCSIYRIKDYTIYHSAACTLESVPWSSLQLKLNHCPQAKLMQ